MAESSEYTDPSADPWNPTPDNSLTRSVVAPVASQPGVTRRSLRTARGSYSIPASFAGEQQRAAASAPSAKPASNGATKSHRGRGVLNIVVMTFATGLVATVALPSYAFDPIANADAQFAGSDLESMRIGGAQSLEVADAALATKVSIDAFGATTEEELAKARAAAAAKKAAEAQRAAAAETFAYDGPSSADYLENPAYPDFSLDKVYSVGLQYQGVPYVYGGATPSGFDCSGFVMYVYAQFGIPLAHSVHQQAASGTVISAADAQPGDLVIFSDGSHDGIYAGNGNVLHAPYEGASVRVQPIWDSVYYVRLGI